MLQEPVTTVSVAIDSCTAPRETRAKFDVGQRVFSTLVDGPLRVVEATAYGPTAQSYMLEHDDPAWVPPGDRRLRINTNYGRPRLCVGLDEIVGVVPPGVN